MIKSYLTRTTCSRPVKVPLLIHMFTLCTTRHILPPSQSYFLSAGVAVRCWRDDGGSRRGLLDGGEADVGGAVQIAGLALRAGTATTTQLTEKEERVLECTKYLKGLKSKN